MAATQPAAGIGPDTLITVKILFDNQNRRFKLALRDLGAHALPQKLRFLLAIPADCEVKFDRFSDSAGSYIALDSANPAVYKQLYRAAKAKLKLKLRATIVRPAESEERETLKTEPASLPRQSTYLETVLSQNPPSAELLAPHIPTLPAYMPPAGPLCASKLPRTLFDTAPALDPFSMPVAVNTAAAQATRAAELSRPTIPTLGDFALSDCARHASFSIDCNNCGKSVPDEHYHCSICEFNDFDLCQSCVTAGVTCYNDDHWLIKRTIANGKVSQSTTERLPPKAQKLSGFTKADNAPAPIEERTCNNCISQLPASSFLTCQDCPDFDLCFDCFESDQHGHHPAHVFAAVDAKSSRNTAAIRKLCTVGRGTKHEALCDGCDQHIYGIRNKCLTCPDFDFCNSCVANAQLLHPGHRFAPILSKLGPVPDYYRKEVHRGVYCDGPLCITRTRKTWIRGDRYKCAICPNTDFCANCEAVPRLRHNQTHPLIKIRMPLRNISVSAFSDEHDGQSVPLHVGHLSTAKNASTETVVPASANAATQVQTVAEFEPEPNGTLVSTAVEATTNVKPAVNTGLEAWFESDSTPDGTSVGPERLVSQSWTVRNPGPHAWPAGCAVHFVGGDDMRNLDMHHPSDTSNMTLANRSNVLDGPVEPGNTAVFTVLLRSPARDGRAISYWRLKTHDGVAFGHKLWVDISVAKPAPVIPKAAPAVPVPDAFELEKTENETQDSSIMVFPKLEKESPESSIHAIAPTPAVVSTGDTATAAQEEELIEDLASLDFEEDDTDDGFLTDEEYDILDASDEDFLAEAERAVRQRK